MLTAHRNTVERDRRTNDLRAAVRGFALAVAIGWVLLAVAGLMYARSKGIPEWATAPVLAAFLLEYPLYLVCGFARLREAIAARLRGLRLAFALAGSALLPYVVFSVGTGQFEWWLLTRLAALALAISLWYVVLPPGAWSDAALLLLIASALLLKYFDPIYAPPVRGLDAEILGHLALVRISVLVLLIERGVRGTGFGFLPRAVEWRTGIYNYLLFLPIGVPLALVLGVARIGAAVEAWKIGATFFGVLWVVALSEEFFFRGVLQQWMAEWTGNRSLALLFTAILFGAVHLPFRSFPNWRFALVAAVAGWFYGRAFEQAHSIRAGMVAHALVVTTWRALLH